MNRGWRHLVSTLWRRPVASLKRSSVHVYRWFQSPVGMEMLRQQLELLEQCRQEYKGDVMLQISGCGKKLMGKRANRRHKIVLSSHSPRKYDQDLDGYSWLISDFDQIPLEEGSADFLVLHHVLEFSENPHDVLREAVRVLSPNGHLVLICFNPYSLFGLRKNLQLAWRKSIPWAHHGLSVSRISDWLHLMSCEPMNFAGGFYGFPFQSERWISFQSKLDAWFTSWGFPCGGFYVVHASKRTMKGIDVGVPIRKPKLVPFPSVASATRGALNEKSLINQKQHSQTSD